MIFHLTSRTHRGEPLFVPGLRSGIANLIVRMAGRTDARLLAYAVMPNHLHILLRQGEQELFAVMQPLLRRIAHRVQVWHRFEGSVVERRYRDRPCETPGHLREALLYIHLNPWRAGLCGEDLDYPWMSHGAYLPTVDPLDFGIDPDVQLRLLDLFATGDDLARDQLCRDYLRWIRWRMDQDRIRIPDPTGNGAETPGAARPLPGYGSPSSQRNPPHRFAPRIRYSVSSQREALLPDLHDFATRELDRIPCDCTLESLRGSWLPRTRVRIRARLIRAATQRGYRTGKVARFFDISPSSVSRIKYSPEPLPIES